MKETYWIEILNSENEMYWYWRIKCINGTTGATSKFYARKFTCFSNAKSFAEYTGLKIK
jgi:uncharacterized protein YegP (UPF0339 family)